MTTFPGLRLPVVAAPMFLISGPDLVVAACKSGIVGSFPAPNCRTADDPDRLAKSAERVYDSTTDVAARWKDLWAAGQGLQAVRSVEPVAAVVARLAEEYRAAAGRLSRLVHA